MTDIENKPQGPVNGGTTAVPADNPQHPQPRPCPQDCSKCSTPQHVFCSAKMLFDFSRAYQEQRQQTAELAKAIANIQEQLKPKQEDTQLSLPFVDKG